MLRPIHLAQLDKVRPALVLTRPQIRHYRHWVTVAPITRTARGLATEVPLEPGRNGVTEHCVIDCDSIATIRVEHLGRAVGRLLADQEEALAAAIAAAFDLNG